MEELPEAASRVLLRVGGHLQDELHDYSLVGHLLHQRFFLLDTKDVTLCPDTSQRVLCVSGAQARAHGPHGHVFPQKVGNTLAASTMIKDYIIHHNETNRQHMDTTSKQDRVLVAL